MTTISRRKLLQGAAGLPFLGLVSVEFACTSAQTNAFINILDEITVGIESALPIITLLTPAPFNLILPEVAGFLNLANAAATQTATELSSGDAATVQARNILAYWASVVLDPSVLVKLPSNVNNVNTAALISAVVNAINHLLSQIAATVPGTSVRIVPANAIESITVSGASMRALSAGKPFPISALSKAKVGRIKTKLEKNHAKLAGK